MLFRVLNLSTLIYSKSCECDVLYCTLIFHESYCAAPVWRNMFSLWLLISVCLQLEHWLFELHAFGFLLPSNMIHFSVAVSLLLFDAPCFFQSPWTLSAQEYSVLVFWSWCCFVCSIIPTWYISSLVILMRHPILRLLMNVMCRPSKMEYAFMMQLITRSAHKSNVLHFGRLCFWVPVCFNQELLRFFSELMFYWFSVLHLVFPFLLDN